MGFFNCWLHFLLIAQIVIYTLLQIAFYSLLSGKKRELKGKTKNGFLKWIKTLSNADIAFIGNISFNLVLWIIFVIVPHCWFCIILLIIYFIWILGSIGILFFRMKFINFMLKKLKKGKKTDRKAKLIAKLTGWKNQFEFDEAAITLNDAFNIAPILDETKRIDLEVLNNVVKTFGNCEIKEHENVGGRNVIQNCWTYYVTIKGKNDKIKKKTFAYVFDIKKNGGKGKGAVLLLRIEPKDYKDLFRFYKNAAISKFPLGREFVAFPITNFVSLDSCEIYLRKACDFATKDLEEQEFDKMSKKIKM